MQALYMDHHRPSRSVTIQQVYNDSRQIRRIAKFSGSIAGQL